GAVERIPRHVDVAEAERPRVLLDEFLILHDVELQVAHGELLGQTDFRRLRSGWNRKRRRQQAGKQQHSLHARVPSTSIPSHAIPPQALGARLSSKNRVAITWQRLTSRCSSGR